MKITVESSSYDGVQYTLAYTEEPVQGKKHVLLTDFDQVSVTKASPTSIPTTPKDALVECDQDISVDAHLMAKAADHHTQKKMKELEEKIRAQDTELRTLRRQLSLSTPLETSPSKAQLQAQAMKGKSLLNPRVKRSKVAKQGLFSDSDEGEADQT